MTDLTIGIGPTEELSLRVSVATLTRVVFPLPGDGVEMLGLEHKATLISDTQGGDIALRVQPFGGAVRISDPKGFQKKVGKFTYDSERSRNEQDCRVYISPNSWDVLREYCLNNLHQEDDRLLDSDPARELVEEFDDTLGFDLKPDDFMIKPAGVVLENAPASTENLRAAGNLTVRVYRVDEVWILDPALCRMIMGSSDANPGPELREKAAADALNGGKGRANAVFCVPLEEITGYYLGLDPGQRGEQQSYRGTVLAGNVAAVLDRVPVPKYR